MAQIAYLECAECGHVAMSFDRARILDKADHHMDDEPTHDLYLHVFESDESRKLT